MVTFCHKLDNGDKYVAVGLSEMYQISSVSFRNCSNSYLDEFSLIARYTLCTVIILSLTNIGGLENATRGLLPCQTLKLYFTM